MNRKIKSILNYIIVIFFKIFGTKEQKEYINNILLTTYKFSNIKVKRQQYIIEHLKKLGAKKWRKKKI